LSYDAACQMLESEDQQAACSGISSLDRDKVVPSGCLEFFTRDPEQSTRVGFRPGSIFEQLKKVSQQLRKELFPPWSEAEAVWVILTGKVRATPQPLVGEAAGYANEHLTYGTINLTVQSWVATEVVAKIYQWLQAQMLGRKPRALSERNLRVPVVC
jgi:hypothetical protein